VKARVYPENTQAASPSEGEKARSWKVEVKVKWKSWREEKKKSSAKTRD